MAEESINVESIAKWRINTLKNVDHLRKKLKKINDHERQNNTEISIKALRSHAYNTSNTHNKINVANMLCKIKSRNLSPIKAQSIAVESQRISISDLFYNLTKTRNTVNNTVKSIACVTKLLNSLQNDIHSVTKFNLKHIRHQSTSKTLSIKKNIKITERAKLDNVVFQQRINYMKQEMRTPRKAIIYDTASMFLNGKMDMTKEETRALRCKQGSLRMNKMKLHDSNKCSLRLIGQYKDNLKEDSKNVFISSMEESVKVASNHLSWLISPRKIRNASLNQTLMRKFFKKQN